MDGVGDGGAEPVVGGADVRARVLPPHALEDDLVRREVAAPVWHLAALFQMVVLHF